MTDPMFKQHLAWLLGSLLEKYLPPVLLAASLIGLAWLVRSTIRTGAVTMSRHWHFAIVVMGLVGGITGWMLANAGVDRALHNTYYIVAHFHYLIGAIACFSAFALWYEWVPKLAGLQSNMRLAKIHFWLTCIGTTMLFFPQHLLGLVEMPQNYADYPDEFAKWNRVSKLGNYIVAGATLLFVGSVVRAIVARRVR